MSLLIRKYLSRFGCVGNKNGGRKHIWKTYNEENVAKINLKGRGEQTGKKFVMMKVMRRVVVSRKLFHDLWYYNIRFERSFYI